MGQHTVGDHFDIAANTGNGIHQRQPVERTGGVVGDNDQGAMFGDLFKIVSRNGAADLQVFKHLLNHIQPFQVGMAFRKLLELAFIKQSSEQILLPGCGSGLWPEVVEYIVETKHGGFSSRLAKTVKGEDDVYVSLQ
ncbi:Hypothetical protein AKI40_3970 [Enterobacter sp. FY-07]|nr:Hypothetical protein AKI40_3970 [Enterobacter sp. FY-07]